ncbi:hypothetical protein OEZ85_013893 [Tetradesmus obliquus]|uniref:Dilute domain-containing protein n=1 Tax=Tetradesmus obliquus TaxID=3088 RepID=A0ABY8U6S6_TETOB|nr:hypothetical protein OEZ85_013893 [Tetradesmus obliquus]
MEQAQGQRDCVRPQGDRLANVSLVLGLDKRLHEAEETIQQLQREIDRHKRAGCPPHTATPASVDNTASSSPRAKISSSSSSSTRAAALTSNSFSGWLNRSAKPGSLDVAVAAAHTGREEPAAAAAAAAAAGDTGAGAASEQQQQQQQQQEEAQLQRLAELKQEVLELRAALAAQNADAAGSAAALDALARDQGTPPRSPLAGNFAGSFAGNAPAPQSPLQKQRSSIVQKQASGLPALPTESAAAEAFTSSSAAAAAAAAGGGGGGGLPQLVKTHSAEKVAVLMQELRVALAEQEATKGEVPAGVRSGLEELEDVSEEEFRLLSALSQPLGFHRGKPLAALAIFRCCLQWGTLEARRTRLFQHITQVILAQIEQQQQDINSLAYWLANVATLLHLLQRNTQPDLVNGAVADQQQQQRGKVGAKLASWLAPLIDRGSGVIRLQRVTVKAPGQRFMQQLEVLLHKIYPKIREGVKRRIMPMLWESQSSCIYPAIQQDPPGNSSSSGTPAALNTHTSSQPEQQHITTSISRSSSSERETLLAAIAEEDPLQPLLSAGGAAGAAKTAANAKEVREWSSVLAVFDEVLLQLHNNWVPQQVVSGLFCQLFAFVDAQLFNQVMLRRECCSLANAEQVFAGLDQVAWWIDDRWELLGGCGCWQQLTHIRHAAAFLTEPDKPTHVAWWIDDRWELLGGCGCWQQLTHIRQAAAFLTEPDKATLNLVDIADELCPTLTPHQLYRLASMFNDDETGTEGVNAEILAELKSFMVEEWRAASSSFLLDDASEAPLPTADMLAGLDDKELYVPLPVPEQLRSVEGRDDSAFDFLEQQLRFTV